MYCRLRVLLASRFWRRLWMDLKKDSCVEGWGCGVLVVAEEAKRVDDEEVGSVEFVVVSVSGSVVEGEGE